MCLMCKYLNKIGYGRESLPLGVGLACFGGLGCFGFGLGLVGSSMGVLGFR